MDNRDRGRMSNWFSSEQGNKGNQQLQSSGGAPSKRYVVVKSQKEKVTVTSHSSGNQTQSTLPQPPPHFQHYPVQDAPQFTQYGHTPNKRPQHQQGGKHQQGGNQQHGQFSNNNNNLSFIHI
eukprot:TRINITY_DN1551_c0_g1_i1.p1 TRINITY_DN1551_c0_g1~~TRINITY_DN1551_c0_g1_i1.p1  ORF type:complete len:122 (-),score=20.55 TRINITY_DN1551_c0_g1_i1:23-388(-)